VALGFTAKSQSSDVRAGQLPISRLLVINRTTDNKRLYRDESGSITSAL
jgi:hypothetical protein